MKKLILLFLYFIVSCEVANAQFTGMDASMYPVIRAYGSGPMFNNARTQDFTVLENGIDMKATLKSDCKTIPDDPALSAVLVIDLSNSMNVPVGGGKIRLDWVKEGAKTFLNNLTFNNNTYIAIIVFNGDAYLKSDFLNNRDALLQVVDNISNATGSTRFDPPFLDPNIGAIKLLNSRPSWIRRSIIFLTDGIPNPTPPTSTQTIISKLTASKIKTYAICMGGDVAQELRDIAQKSGGQLFTSSSLESLNSIYGSLATSSRQTVTYCWIEWISPPGCTEASRNRNVNIKYKPTNLPFNSSYIAPPSSVSGIINSVVSLPAFADIPAGNSAQQQYTITAQNADMRVSGASIIPTGNFAVVDWGGSNPPFTLTKGTSRTITVQFTQTAPRDARSAQLLVTGTPCSAPVVLLSGGIRKITLLTPNGGELFSTCDSLFISWTGVDETDTVKLEYSTDAGNSWLMVAPFATHNFYNWKPPISGTYLIRVTPYSPKPSGAAWTRTGGGIGADTSTAITVTEDGTTIYLTGDFNKQATFDGKPITSTKTQEAFLARYNNEKILWTISGSSFLTQLAPYSYSAGKGVAIDPTDLSCYVLGDIMPNASNHNEIFIAKILPNGKLNWVRSITSSTDVHSLRIGRDSATKKLYIEGLYQGIMKIRLVNGQTPQLQAVPANIPRLFLAFIDEEGNFTSLQDSTYQPKFNPRSVKDSIGNTYETSIFSGNFTSGDTTIRSVGSRDFYLRRIGRMFTQSDVSDSYCTISDPNFGFAYQPTTVGVAQIGDYHDTTFTAMLCNKGTIPITFTDYKFEGNYPADFSLISALKGITIPRDSCITLTIRFTPSATSYLSSVLRVYTECSDQQIIFTGFGIDRQARIDSLNWYQKRVLTDNLDTMWIKNTGTTDLKINKLTLETQPENNFVMIPPPLPLTIKVNESKPFFVLFNPQDTLTYHNAVLAEVEGFSKPLIGTLDGIGVLPEIRGLGYEFKPTFLNTLSPEIGSCKVFNPSTTSSTVVKEVKFIDNPGDFEWETPPPTNFTIQQNTTETIPFNIRFTPKAIGNREAYIQITSDAVPGPDITIPKYDTVKITGKGFFTPFQVDSVIDFGTLLGCDTAVKFINVINIDPANSVKISSVKYTGDSNFQYTPFDSLIIPTGGTVPVPVTFRPTPSENKTYSGEMILTTETGLEFKVQISGSSYTVKGEAHIITDVPTFEPGTRISVTASATVENLANSTLGSLTLILTVPPQVLSVSQLYPILANWTWKIDDTEQLQGIFRIKGTANQPTKELQSEKLFSLELDTYLEKKGSYPISLTAQSPLECLTMTAQGTSVEMLSACFGDARVVGSTGKSYYLSLPNPNPGTDVISFDVSVGLTAKAVFTFANQIGEVIKTIEIPSLEAGDYHITIPVDDISGGVYTITFSSGQFTTARQSVIVR